MVEVVLLRNFDIAIDFVSDAVLYGEDYPSPKYVSVDGVVSPTILPARFLVISTRLETRRYFEEAAEMHSFVLMDGSDTVFKACTSSTLAATLKYHRVQPGSTLTVHDYQLIRIRCSRDEVANMVMLINKMSWQAPPNKPDKVRGVPRDSLVVFLRSLLEAVGSRGCVRFTVPYQNALRAGMNRACAAAQIPHGDWIIEPATRCDWQAFMKAKNWVQSKFCFVVKNVRKIRLSFCLCVRTTPPAGPPDSPGGLSTASTVVPEDSGDVYYYGRDCCECVFRLGLICCVAKSFPVLKLNFEDIFCYHATVVNCPYASRWGELTNSDKRRCLHWWYAVNICSMLSEGGALPCCLTQAIEDAFPYNYGVPYKSNTMTCDG